MKDIAVYVPQFDKEEKEEIQEWNKKIWDRVKTKYNPIKGLGNPCFIRHSIKIEINSLGDYEVLDTTTEPYSPIYNMYILEMIYNRIMEDYFYSYDEVVNALSATHNLYINTVMDAYLPSVTERVMENDNIQKTIIT